MRRTLTVLAATAALAFGGAVVAGPAAAAPSDTALGAASARSVHFYCGSDTDTHPGRHEGWDRQPSGELRNLGGTCPV